MNQNSLLRLPQFIIDKAALRQHPIDPELLIGNFSASTWSNKPVRSDTVGSYPIWCNEAYQQYQFLAAAPIFVPTVPFGSKGSLIRRPNIIFINDLNITSILPSITPLLNQYHITILAELGYGIPFNLGTMYIAAGLPPHNLVPYTDNFGEQGPLTWRGVVCDGSQFTGGRMLVYGIREYRTYNETTIDIGVDPTGQPKSSSAQAGEIASLQSAFPSFDAYANYVFFATPGSNLSNIARHTLAVNGCSNLPGFNVSTTGTIADDAGAPTALALSMLPNVIASFFGS